MAYGKPSFSGEELEDWWNYKNDSIISPDFSDAPVDDLDEEGVTKKIIHFYSVFLPVLYTLILVVGLVGNGLVLANLCRMRRTWSITNIFILHLSVADLLLLITLPFRAAEAVQGWTFGTPLCKLMGAILMINFFCGIFLLACISLDCYLSIVHGVQMYSCQKPWQVQASCLFLWFFCLILSIPDWVFLESVQYGNRPEMYMCVHNYYSMNWQLASRLLYHIVGFLIPSGFMIFCYSCILLHRGSQDIQKQKTMHVFLVLVVAFFICWVPLNVTHIVVTVYISNAINMNCKTYMAFYICMTVTSMLGYMHCCLNPILYAIFGVKLQK